jgi:hypothetical protein
MKNKIEIRFNLAKGKNYLKWRIKFPNKKVLFLEPEKVQIILINSILINHKKTALKIYQGSYKTPCAWIFCDDIKVLKENLLKPNENSVKYNPKIQPNWLLNNKIIDNQTFQIIFSFNKKLYVS